MLPALMYDYDWYEPGVKCNAVQPKTSICCIFQYNENLTKGQVNVMFNSGQQRAALYYVRNNQFYL
jgi:hypothetical protein